jgi:hypothetical protein
MLEHEIKAFKLSEKNTMDSPLYGAVDIVKGQLPYQLGTTMIQQSRSVLGWLTMLFALIKVIWLFRCQRVNCQNKVKIPLSKYADADKAERVKQHLAYRLGTILIKYGKNPLYWIALPWVIFREIKNFRQQRHANSQ